MTTTTVEELARQIRSTPADAARLDLWVPDDATLRGEAVPPNPTGLVSAILVDVALGAGLWPDGATAGEGGSTYHFTRSM